MTLPKPLTPRQREIAELVAGGYSDKQIASAVGLHENTVGWHITRIGVKLGVHHDRSVRVQIAVILHRAA